MSSLVQDRKALLEKMKIERESESKRIALAKAAEEVSKNKLFWQNTLYLASVQKGNLNISWTPLKKIDPMLFGFNKEFSMPLVALRLVGVELESLPDDFGNHLMTLKSLSLSSNKLTTLPDSIVLLTNLTDLNLLKNNLVSLPERMGLMCSLTTLFVANNKLESLPITFGALNLMERVDLECNKLRVLPENLDNMTMCRTFLANNNKLIRLPRCLARMPNLTSLSACHNKITYIPQVLFESDTLLTIRLSDNLITLIPENIGRMSHLQELSLDYNDIKRLPVDFYKLESLKILRIEGNPRLDDPPPEIIAQGAEATVGYCRALFNDREVYRMRAIIFSMQDVLRQIEERELADPSQFEPHTMIPEDKYDEWYALQYDYLWGDLLPDLKNIWHQESLQGIKAKDGHVNAFDYEQKDVIWAFSGFGDAYGPMIRKGKAMFRRCACVDQLGRRMPCVPPKPGFMCYRMCTLLKARIVQKKEKDDRLWVEYKKNGIADAIKRSKNEAEGYLKSSEGSLWLEKSAFAKAEDIVMEQGVDRAVAWRNRIADRKKKAIIRKFDGRKKKIEKSRNKKTKDMEEELARLKEEERMAPEGYMRTVVTSRINDLTTRMARLEETVQLQRLQRECEEECERVDKAMEEEAETTSGSEIGEDSLPSTEDEGSEAEKIRHRYQRQQRGRELEEKYAKVPEANDSWFQSLKDFSKHVSAMMEAALEGQNPLEAEVKKPLIQRNVYEEIQEYKDFQRKKKSRSWRRIKKLLMHAIDVADIRVRRVFMKGNGGFDDIQKELKHEIAYHYVNSMVEEARMKAEKEFEVIDTVRRQWGGIGLEMVFKEWKKWTKEKKNRRRKDLRMEYRTKTKALDTAMESVRLARAQVNLWKKCTDVHTDIPFWKHSLFGDVTYEEPGIHHYLPPQFMIPEAPKPLPPDVSYDSTSQSSSQEEEQDENDDEEGSNATDNKNGKKKNNKKLLTGKSNKKLKRNKNSRVSTAVNGITRDEMQDESLITNPMLQDQNHQENTEKSRPMTANVSSARKWKALHAPVGLSQPDQRIQQLQHGGQQSLVAATTSSLQVAEYYGYYDDQGYYYEREGYFDPQGNFFYYDASVPGYYDCDGNFLYYQGMEPEGIDTSMIVAKLPTQEASLGVTDSLSLSPSPSHRQDANVDVEEEISHSHLLSPLSNNSSRSISTSPKKLFPMTSGRIGSSREHSNPSELPVIDEQSSLASHLSISSSIDSRDAMVQKETTHLTENNDIYDVENQPNSSSVIKEYAYGPDSLRAHLPGRVHRAIFQEDPRTKVVEARVKYDQYAELFRRVDDADRFMNSSDYHSERVSFDNLVPSNMGS